MKDFDFPHEQWTEDLVRRSLLEDIGTGDATTAVTVQPGQELTARITSREKGVVAGLPVVDVLFAQLESAVNMDVHLSDGSSVEPGDVVATLRGPAEAILTAERTVLNFLQHLSGIATLTSNYVAEVQGTHCRVLDTRKTLPGYRHLAKYAVRCGGGHNHRMGLYDRIMLKDNHWAAAEGKVADLVARSRQDFPGLDIEVEVDTLEQLDLVLPLDVQWIMLDNFSFADTEVAVARRRQSGAKVLLETSGNVTLETIGRYARTGVDAASVGRLTHSVAALDLGLDIEGRP